MMTERLKIGQVAKLYGISTDTLRLYERKGLLQPECDSENNYRYYRLSQLDTLELILNCKQAGLSLSEIRQLIHSEDLSTYLDAFHKQESAIDEKIRLLQQAKNYTQYKAQCITSILQRSEKTDTIAAALPADARTLYLIETALLLTIGANPSDTDGMCQLESWRLFDIDVNGHIKENQRLIGFSFAPTATISALENDFLTLYQAGGADCRSIDARFNKTTFLGTMPALTKYLHTLHATVSPIYVKFLLTLAKKQTDHQFLVDIYFR